MNTFQGDIEKRSRLIEREPACEFEDPADPNDLMTELLADEVDGNDVRFSAGWPNPAMDE